MLKPAFVSSATGASSTQLKVIDQVSLCLGLSTIHTNQRFYICQRLAAEVILCCDLCDLHVKSIHAQRNDVELMEGTWAPIVRKSPQTDPYEVPLTISQEYL